MPTRRIRVVSALLLGAPVLAAACADSPTAPRASAATSGRAQDMSKLEIGLVADTTALSVAEHRALGRELVRAGIDAQGQPVGGDLDHLSGYLVSTGRDRSFKSVE